jgi:glucose-1-phosphate thymidylyltransferase
MKTILAAGGEGTRLLPMTRYMNKHLCPIGKNELMIDKPLKFIRLHFIDELTIVTGSKHAAQIVDYIQDGSKYGFKYVEYSFQDSSFGIADVLNRVAHRDSSEGILLLLGDNYFERIQTSIFSIPKNSRDAYVWEYDIGSLEQAKRFGQVLTFSDGQPYDIVEKPDEPDHTRILTGLYYFPSDVFSYVKGLSMSDRGELEITSLLRVYLREKRLIIHQVDGQWCDLGEDETWMKFVSSRVKI